MKGCAPHAGHHFCNPPQSVCKINSLAVAVRRRSCEIVTSNTKDHLIQRRVIFPGAGYLEMARAVGATALRGVHFLQPLAVEAAGLLVECAIFDGRFEVRSCEADAPSEPAVHCSGASAGFTVSEQVDHASLRAPSRGADVGALYDGFDAVGLQYGPGYRTLVHAWGSASIAVARLRAASASEGTQVHPADLDDALCTSVVIASNSGDGETRLPFAVDGAMLQCATGEPWAVRCCCNRNSAFGVRVF